MKKVTLGDVCNKAGSNIAQKDLQGNEGKYPIYGAGGLIKKVDFYQQELPYIAVVKDGAGIGRTMLLPGHSSVIGTVQYILPINRETVDLKYLYYAIVHMNLSKYFSGATIPHIYFKDYKKEPLRLPELEKQREIASVFQRIDELIAKREQQLKELDGLVKSRFIEMFGDPDVNNKGWNIYRMEQLCEVGSSKRIYQNEQSIRGIPFLRVSDLVNRIDTGSKECDLYISRERFEKLKEQGLTPASGDILLTARGTLGRCYIIQDGDEFYFQDGMITWLSKFDTKITPLYITYLFEMSGFRKQIVSLQSGSIVAYLSISMTKKLDVMVPPIELQNQFADFVAQTDKSKLAVQKSLDELETLKKSLMQEYFG